MKNEEPEKNESHMSLADHAEAFWNDPGDTLDVLAKLEDTAAEAHSRLRRAWSTYFGKGSGKGREF